MKNLYLLTSFICGAIVMIIEIVGTKILSPFFGSGLFVWSSTITVAMLALSIGYFIGGKNADKKENLSNYLYSVVFIAGTIILFTYEVSRIIYLFYDLIDIKLLTFISAFLLLFPSLVFLGMISPIVVKLTTTEIKQVGKDLGSVSSISTLGSLVGSLLAGFILLSYFSSKQIFFYCGVTLLALSAIYFLKKKNYIYIGLMFILIPMSHDTFGNILEIKNEHITVIEQKENFYGKTSIVDVGASNDPSHQSRLMLLDGMPQGQINKKTNKGAFPYPYVIEEIISQVNSSYNNRYKEILFLGIGAGIMPSNLDQKYNLTLVDINPVVVDYAKKYFNLKNDVVIEDARVFINKTKNKYDIIVVDVFSGDTLPSHLLSQEFMTSMNRKLNKDGLVIFNVIGDPYNGIASKSIIKTISSEFSSITLTALKEEKTHVINYIVTAANRKIEIDKSKLLTQIHSRVTDNENLSEYFDENRLDLIKDLNNYNDGEIITDAFNRIDFYSLEERKEIRQSLLKYNIVVN